MQIQPCMVGKSLKVDYCNSFLDSNVYVYIYIYIYSMYMYIWLILWGLLLEKKTLKYGHPQ